MDKKFFDEFVKRLAYHNTGEGVNDHCTANPIFIVQSKRRISGICLDYDPDHYWTDEEFEVQLTDEELKAELAEWVKDGGSYTEFDIDRDDKVLSCHDGGAVYTKIGFAEVWEFVNAHFTRESAQEFVDKNSHRHSELRISVDCQWRCPEWNAIVSALLSGDISLSREVEEREAKRWGDRFDFLHTKYEADCSGCDSADPLDCVEAEVGQVIARLTDEKWEADKRCDRANELIEELYASGDLGQHSAKLVHEYLGVSCA